MTLGFWSLFRRLSERDLHFEDEGDEDGVCGRFTDDQA